MEERKSLTIDKNNNIIDLDGSILCKTDFVASKPFVPRYYDYTTKNISFLNLHVFLKKMGVKNHNEHLQLFNKDLVGVDPHDPVLTDDQKFAIDVECRINPWYYIREVVRLNTSGGAKVRYRLGIEGFTALWLMFRCVNILFEAPRQVGKTTTVGLMISWLLNFGGKNINMGNIHYEADRAKANLSRIDEVMNNLPDYLQYHKKVLSKPDKDGNIAVKDKARSAAKKETISVPVFNNVIETFVVGKSPDDANNTGRGTTTPIWMIDEFAHIKYNNIAFGAFAPSYSEASRAARRNGILYGIWTMCTPGDLKTEYGQWVKKLIDKEYLHFNKTHFGIFDLTKIELEKYLARFSRQSTVYISFKFDQLGYSTAWLSEKSKALEMDKIRTEYLLKWEVQTDVSPFNTRILSKLDTKANINQQYERIEQLDSDNELRYYPKPEDICHDFSTFLLNYPGGIVMGSDISYGVGGESDSTTLVGVDPKTLRVLFVYKSNTMPADDFAILLIRILSEFIEPIGIPAALAIERNGNGYSLIRILKKYPFLVKYFVLYEVSEYKVNNAYETDFNFVYKGVSTKFDIGLNITAKTRAEFMNLLMQIVSKHTDAIAIRPIVDELKTLIYKKMPDGSTKIQHAVGEHDDTIFGMLHAMYAIFRNADLLEQRNKIVITPENFIISENQSVINSTGKFKSRIYTSLTSKDGKLIESYYDTYTKKYVSAEVAAKLEIEAKEDVLLSNNEKIHEEPEEIGQKHLETVKPMIGIYGDKEIVSISKQGENVYEKVEQDNRDRESINLLFDELFKS